MQYIRSKNITQNSNIKVPSNNFNTASSTITGTLRNVPGLSLNGQGGLLQRYSCRGFSR